LKQLCIADDRSGHGTCIANVRVAAIGKSYQPLLEFHISIQNLTPHEIAPRE